MMLIQITIRGNLLRPLFYEMRCLAVRFIEVKLKTECKIISDIIILIPVWCLVRLNHNARKYNVAWMIPKPNTPLPQQLLVAGMVIKHILDLWKHSIVG